MFSVILLTLLILLDAILFSSRGLRASIALIEQPYILILELVLLGLTMINPITIVLLLGVLYMACKHPITAKFYACIAGIAILLSMAGLVLFIIGHTALA